MNYQYRLAGPQRKRAMARYRRRFKSNLYEAALKGKSNSYANGLKGDAMAICGHPDCKLSHRRHAEAAKTFLWHMAQAD